MGSFLNVRALEKVGLVNPRYFIYYDDSEHSIRLRRFGRIVCLPKMKVLHDYTEKSDESVIVSWADYYAVRNKTNMLVKHFPIIAFRQFCGHVIMLLKHSSDPYKQVYIKALRDGYFGRLGKSKKYYPGWSVKKG